jgi:hypothetical protein
LKNIIYISILIILTGCDNFEKHFYEKVDQGQINAIKNGSDTFNLATVTDFEWDSVILICGNESVPFFKEQIEEVLNNRTSEVHWEDRRFKEFDDPKLIYKTSDLPINRDRFYFLTPDKKIVEKEIKSGIYKHRPAFDLNYCLVDSTNERYWLSKNECKFILQSNSQIPGQGTVFFYPACKTKFLPGNVTFFDN